MTAELDLARAGMRCKYEHMIVPKEIVVSYTLRSASKKEAAVWTHSTRLRTHLLQRIYPSSCMLQLPARGVLFEIESLRIDLRTRGGCGGVGKGRDESLFPERRCTAADLQ